MTLLLSIPEFLSQHPERAAAENAVRSPWKIPLYDPTGRSYGYRQEVNLRPGLNVLIDSYTLKEDLIVETSNNSNFEPSLGLELSFTVSGHNVREKIQARHNFLSADWGSDENAQFHWQAGEQILKFDIHLDASLFETLIGEQIEGCPELLAQLLSASQPSSLCFWQVHSTTAAMHSIIQQLLNCPYQGPTRWLYWEAKVLELIALRLERMRQPGLQFCSSLSSEDVERVYYARDILRDRLIDPPTLLELSRLVGLNDCTLKKGFRQIFDTTVFGYLSQQRMDKARQLLLAQQSIAVVASAVGYASPTAFSGAFRRRFGLSPKKYQMSDRRVFL